MQNKLLNLYLEPAGMLQPANTCKILSLGSRLSGDSEDNVFCVCVCVYIYIGVRESLYYKKEVRNTSFGER